VRKEVRRVWQEGRRDARSAGRACWRTAKQEVRRRCGSKRRLSQGEEREEKRTNEEGGEMRR